LNDGKVEPQGLKFALQKVLKKVDEESIDRFIRFLDKEKSGKINYMGFLKRMAEVSNREHNPFKSVIERIAYFIEQNKQTPFNLLKRLAQKRSADVQVPSEEAVPLNVFEGFLKAKIDKKRDSSQLRKFAFMIDIDKDGFITEMDLMTCLNNLNNQAFFKNSGEALKTAAFSSAKKFFPNQKKMPIDRALEICK